MDGPQPTWEKAQSNLLASPWQLPLLFAAFCVGVLAKGLRWTALDPAGVAAASDVKRVALAASSGQRTYKLRYFDAMGVSENIRFMFAIADVPYEDFRYPFKFVVPGDFSTIEMPEFYADRASGLLDPNMGRLPILEVDGVPIGQSKSIERYLAKEFGFMGTSDIEAAQIDSVCEHVRDIKERFGKVQATQGDDEKAAAIDKWYAEELATWCDKLEKSLGEGPFAVGAQFSIADLSIWLMLTDMQAKGDAMAAYQDCPKVQVICEKVGGMPGVKAWLDKRPANPF